MQRLPSDPRRYDVHPAQINVGIRKVLAQRRHLTLVRIAGVEEVETSLTVFKQQMQKSGGQFSLQASDQYAGAGAE